MNRLPFLFFYLAQGDEPNSRSNGNPAAKNTDGFDCSTNDLTIENSSVRNQVQLVLFLASDAVTNRAFDRMIVSPSIVATTLYSKITVA